MDSYYINCMFNPIGNLKIEVMNFWTNQYILLIIEQCIIPIS